MRSHAVIIIIRNMVNPREMPRPLTLTGVTIQYTKHCTSNDKQRKMYE